MLQTHRERRSLLQALDDAYAAGHSLRAEHLFVQALESDLPWNEVCSAAARGIARHFGEHAGG